MTPEDVDRVMEIAESLEEAPHWPRSAYLAALDAEAAPLRIALVVEYSAGAKAQAILEPDTARLKSCPDASQHLSNLSVADADLSQACTELSATCSEDESVAVAGFLVASLMPPEAELELIAVDPGAQRRGFARRLFTELAEKLRAAQVAEVVLEVRASNLPALALYRKLGFVESGRRKDYYQIPVEDALLMRLGLGPWPSG
jgi:ribosomal-protein-alanine N-acetyltransferase